MLPNAEPVIHTQSDSTVQTVIPFDQVSCPQQQQQQQLFTVLSTTRSSDKENTLQSSSVNDLPPSLLNTNSPQHSISCAECPSQSINIPNPISNTVLSHIHFQNRIDIDCETESNHDTALTLSCAGGHEELVTLLLQQGANIEHRDKKGFTPLILAGIFLVRFFIQIHISLLSNGWIC